MKRVYVMDCGDFLKVGVSENPDTRKDQIKQRVKRYYSTEPINNAFEIEKFMHDVLHPVKNNSVGGREYFDMDFDIVCKLLESSIKSSAQDREQIVKGISQVESEGFNDKNRKFDKAFYEMVNMTIELPEEDLLPIYYLALGLLTRREMLEERRAV